MPVYKVAGSEGIDVGFNDSFILSNTAGAICVLSKEQLPSSFIFPNFSHNASFIIEYKNVLVLGDVVI